MTNGDRREFAERIVHYLLEGAGNADLATFLGSDVKGLKLSRDPMEEDLPGYPRRVALTYWQGPTRIDGVANLLKVDPTQIGHALGYVMLIDMDEASDDFHYALCGTRIADVPGFDLTGKRLCDSPVDPGVRLFVAASYRAVLRLRWLVYGGHQGASAMTVGDWHRLILPLGQDGQIKRVMVCNVSIRGGEFL